MSPKPTVNTDATPHLDPLPFGRGEEKTADASRESKKFQQGGRRSFLSPSGGEDQGEGAGLRQQRHIVTQRGRRLRKQSTWAEKILWRELRNHKFAGFKFRQQHDIPPYNLDFYCPSARLAIELDGRGHGHPERQIKDAKRTNYLTALSIKELRFWNFSVRKNLRSILDTILRELALRVNLEEVQPPTVEHNRKPLLKYIAPRNNLAK